MILNMSDIRREGTTLKFHKRIYMESLNKTFATHVKKFVDFKNLRNKHYIISRNKFISRKTMWT